MNSSTLKWAGVLTMALLWGGTVLFAQRVVSVTLCLDVVEGTVPVNIQNQFTTDTPGIHAVVVMEDARAGMVLKGAWVSVDAIETPNYEIDAVELRVTDNGGVRGHFSISRPNNGWPAGNYKFNLYVDGQLATVTTFSIISPQQQNRSAGGWEARPDGAQATTPPAYPSGGNAPVPTAPQAQNPYGSGQPNAAPWGYSGTYTLNAQGNVVTLMLQEDAQNNIAGRLSSTSGINFQVEGMIQEGVAVGSCYDNQGGVFFEASLQGNQLQFNMIEPDANGMPDYNRVRQLVFTRGSGPGYGQMPTQPMGVPQGQNPGGQQNQGYGYPGGTQQGMGQPGGNQHLLQGKFCHWGGSSSSYSGSSYSHTEWAYFDGQGGLTYGSESSFNSDAGLAYGGGPSGERGSYRIVGDQVQMTFGDGSQGMATVKMRQDDGRITELMYEGELYANSLCE